MSDTFGCFIYVFSHYSWSQPLLTSPGLGCTGVRDLPKPTLHFLRKHWMFPGRAMKDYEVGGALFLPGAEEPTEYLVPALGNWTSPLNPPPFFSFFLFWGLASNYLILFTLHPSFMVQKTCRCKYVPPSLTSPPFLIYVISIFLPCTVN